MGNEVTLEIVLALAAKLPPGDRLRLAAQICSEASARATTGGLGNHETVRAVKMSPEEADAFLAEMDAVAEQLDGPFDAARDIREIRAERADRL